MECVCINLNTHFSERCFRSNRFPCREFKSQHTNRRDPAKELKQWCMASFSCWCRCCVRCWLFHRDPLLLFVVSFERHLTIEFLVLFLLHLLACLPIDFFTYGSVWSLLLFHFVPFFAVSVALKSVFCWFFLLYVFFCARFYFLFAFFSISSYSKIACDCLTMPVAKVL